MDTPGAARGERLENTRMIRSVPIARAARPDPTTDRVVMTALQIIDTLGVLAFALSGLMAARSRDMDIVGLFAVALVTAFGGGTLRDLLLDRTPLFWIEHDFYAIGILILAVVFALVPASGRVPERALLVADAFGLGLFAVTGAGYALQAGTSVFIAALMGGITGTCGGVLRDVLCNEVPSLFRQTPLYATCAVVGALCYMLLMESSLGSETATWGGTLAAAALRLAALRWHWVLPKSRH